MSYKACFLYISCKCFFVVFLFNLLALQAKEQNSHCLIEKTLFQHYDLTIEEVILPQNHPLNSILEQLFINPSMFLSPEALELSGFVMKWNTLAANAGTILVASHPAIVGYLIKKYRGTQFQCFHLESYLRRINGARKIANYIAENRCCYLTVPKKWLYRLPPSFNDPITGLPDYLLVVEKMNICDGGWWGGETLERYHCMSPAALNELCFILHDLGGCDAWPQNQPFTRTGKIAFIDTEHLGKCYGDFLERTIQFISPQLVNYAIDVWHRRQIQQPFESL